MTPQSMTQDAPHIVVRPCFDATGKHRTSWDICYRPEPGDKGVGVIASCYGPREQAEQMASALCNQPQMPVLMSQEWLDQKVAADPDSECEVRSTIASDTEAMRLLREARDVLDRYVSTDAQELVARIDALTKGDTT